MTTHYAINILKRRRKRTAIVMVALVVCVSLIGALFLLVDTQRQFALHLIGQVTGGYDMSVRRNDQANSPAFDPLPVEQAIHSTLPGVAAIYGRIEGTAELVGLTATQGIKATVIGLDFEQDQLLAPKAEAGVFPPPPGQVFLSQSAAEKAGVKVGDPVTLSYIQPRQRRAGEAAQQKVSRVRQSSTFVVGGIGPLSGSGNKTDAAVLLALKDMQQMVNVSDQVERLLIVREPESSALMDPQATVTEARLEAEHLKAFLASLDQNYDIDLPKYKQLEEFQKQFAFQQIFISLYGLLSMTVVGLMVNALLNTTVTEQRRDLAVLRVLGSPRRLLMRVVILQSLLLGVVGVCGGLMLGWMINTCITVPILSSKMDMPVGIRFGWNFGAVITPTLLTSAVLAVATINPARQANRTKITFLLNPSAADQPTLDDLTRLRERKPSYSLLITGAVLLVFCVLLLFVVPMASTMGEASIMVGLFFGALLAMIIGVSLVFYFLTVPIERALLKACNRFWPHDVFFVERYCLRGKQRNGLISMMVIMATVLPAMLGAGLAMRRANMETDTRFQLGSDVGVQIPEVQGDGVFTRAVVPKRLTHDDLEELRRQAGVQHVVALTESYRAPASDQVRVRSVVVNAIGLTGDLNDVLFPQLMHWTEGSAAALTELLNAKCTTAKDSTKMPKVEQCVIISEGLSKSLDLHMGQILSVQGAGLDHRENLIIIGIASQLPGFQGAFTSNRESAQQGQTTIFVSEATLRSLRNDPARGQANPLEPILTRIMMTLNTDADQDLMRRVLRANLEQDKGLVLTFTQEALEQAQQALVSEQLMVLALTVMSFVTAMFGILSVSYTAILGRQAEIAMLKAIGAGREALRMIFVGEMVIMTLAAALAGILAGGLLGYAMEYSQRFNQDAPIRWAFDGTTSIAIVLIACVVALLSGLFAVRPVVQQKVMDALRTA